MRIGHGVQIGIESMALQLVISNLCFPQIGLLVLWDPAVCAE